MRSKLTTALATAVALTLVAAVPASAHGPGHGPGHGPDRPTTYLLDPLGPAADDVYPEGVAARGDDFYVSSTTDGTIYRGDLDEPTATPFLPGGQDGRTMAVGLKVDGRTLLVAGGATGRVWAYDLRTRELTGSWQVVQDGTPAFVNDLAVGPRGDVYVTDSLRPVLYRIDGRERRTTGTELLEPVVSFEGTAFTYDQDVNANGLVISRDGRTAVVAKTRTGQLFRVGLTDGSVEVIDLGGGLVAGDGLLLDGHRLLAAEWTADPQSVVVVHLDRDWRSGTVVSRTTDPSFDDPTTIARAGRDLLVVNSQVATRAAGGPPAPFPVSRIPVP
ncbi:SMP-30/gluconolactonase/LRE family protein [Cellulomonas dongxiuzhuiae]|uniref:SMP-30/gluconolactonase/LRE family protein n=1 Tax=Cellulomonas dongxiuzhuiae TaxID=2819979 RepID=UPI001AAFC63D|nr:SMP-30/gluconolactonase/LRE family protein [Cellulomonas dongxiuzhuiae]MBO3095412.1 SMP-30/gluconolactonase/LRE family protein [Cellulomonas dongxiuzhuiae]